MSQIEKIIARFLSVPKDFTFRELVTLLKHFGYRIHNRGKTGGSRTQFTNPYATKIVIHKPHGKKDHIDPAAIRQIIDILKEDGLL